MKWGMKIEAKTAEEIAEIETTTGLRQRINEYSRHDALTQNIMRVAEMQGMSDYEMLLMLSYQALVAREKAEEAYMEYVNGEKI